MKKNRLILATMIILVSSLESLFAKQISVDEAATVAEKFYSAGYVLKSRHNLPLKHVYTESFKNLDCVYVFSCGTDNGYVIVAGDDNVSTPVLGYSDSGSFDVENMPENMKWWLEEYARQVEYQNRYPGIVRVKPATKTAWKDVEPLLKCKWDQGEPYNLMCPQVGWQRCYVGCVATATAQVMYHHRYPAVGTGTHTYRWQSGGKDISENFSKYPLDWKNMLDVYDGDETDEQRKAVATLSYLVGVASDMDYAPNGSGTFNELVPPALYRHFGYDDAMITVFREYFTTEEWDGMIRAEIDASRPVLFSGVNSESGHAFVIDGYNSAGYFHVNWGWGGMSNGYFLTTALDPSAQGAGGSSAGYNFGQTVALGVQPETPDTNHRFHVLQDGNFFTKSQTSAKGNRVNFEFDSRVLTSTVKDKEKFKIGIGFYNEKNELVYDFYYEQPFEIPSGNSFVNCFVSPEIPMTLTDGNYTILPLYETAEDSGLKILSKPYKSGKIYMTVKGSNVQFTNQGSIELEVSNVVTKGHLNQNSAYQVSADFTNVSRDVYNGALTALFYDGTSGRVYQELGIQSAKIKQGKTVQMKFENTLTLNPGKCIFALVDQDYYILYSEEVIIGNPLPDANIGAQLTGVPDKLAIYSVGKFTFKLTNNEPIDFFDNIKTVFAVDGKVVQVFSEGLVEVPAGETVEVAVKGMINPNVVNKSVLFAVVNAKYTILASKEVYIKFSEVPLLYVQDAPELSGNTGFDSETAFPKFNNPEVTYKVKMRNLGADQNGVMFMNVYKMVGDAAELVKSDAVDVKAAYGAFCTVSHTFTGMNLVNGRVYMCELYAADNITPVDGDKTRAFFIYDTESGVENVECVNVAVYPNPAVDVLNIVSKSDVESVRIFNLQGACVMAAEGISELNVSELLPATYIAVIVTEDGKTTTQKVIKK